MQATSSKFKDEPAQLEPVFYAFNDFSIEDNCKGVPMLLESSTSALKKKHPDRTFFSCVVAPTNTSKFYNAIVVFYKTKYFVSASTAYGNYFGDCIVYGRRGDVCDLLGHSDEFYQGSSTYVSILEKGKLSLLNSVSNEKVELEGSFSKISKSMRQAIRIMSPELFRGKIDIKYISEIADRYDELFDKEAGLLYVRLNQRTGVVSMITGEELISPVFSSISYLDSKGLLTCYIGRKKFLIVKKIMSIKSQFLDIRRQIIDAIFIEENQF